MFNISLLNESLGILNYTHENGVFNFDYPCVSKEFCTPYVLEFKPCTLIIEVWGAQGGSVTQNIGGKGGYSRGILHINQITTLFLHIGSSGLSSTSLSPKSYNGGGRGYGFSSSGNAGAGGGGTDLRISQNNLLSRVIVAGGGGGAGYVSGMSGYGGYGGGLNGQNGGKGGSSVDCLGGEQDIAGIGSFDNGVEGWGTHSGEFGEGGSASSLNGATGGGGGGWFGGASGLNNGQGGGGGSGYTFTSSSYVPSGFLLNSEHFLVNPFILHGSDSMPSPFSSSNEIGHGGNGFSRITIVSASNENVEISYYCKSNLSTPLLIILFFTSIIL